MSDLTEKVPCIECGKPVSVITPYKLHYKKKIRKSYKEVLIQPSARMSRSKKDRRVLGMLRPQK